MAKKLDQRFQILTLAIFALAFFLRLVWLGHYPVSLHSQEALLGYRGKLLAAGLTDETNKKLPLIFTSFEGYQGPFSSYLVAISVKMLGLKEWTVRFPLAIFGCLGLVAFFAICRLLFPKNRWLALWATFVIGISPWHVFLSRTVSGANLFFNLFLLGVWSFLVLKAKKRFRTIGILSFLIFFFFSLLIFKYFSLPGVKQDFIGNYLGFFTNPSILNSINQMRGENLQSGNVVLGALFYNKSFYLIQLIEGFLDHLKPSFYFAFGDGNSLHGLSNFGPILFVFLPLFLLGVWFLFQKNELGQKRRPLLVWFFLGIIPSALSYPSPNQEKLILVFPVLAILIGYAFSQLKKYQLGLLVVLLFLNFGFVFYDAINKEPLRGQGDWDYGAKELAGRLQAKQGDFDKILVSDRHSPDLGPLLLFYFDYSPGKLWQETNLIKGQVFYHQWVSRIEKITIGDAANWQINPGEKGLLVVTPDDKDLLNFYRILGRNNQPSKDVCYQINEEILGLDQEPIYLLAEGISDQCVFRMKGEE